MELSYDGVTITSNANWQTKLFYLQEHIMPGLKEAFRRGDETYHGINHWSHPKKINRPATEDIRHMRELHADVRLREAEELADNGDLEGALKKIESAIGYLTILHLRTKLKLEE